MWHDTAARNLLCLHYRYIVVEKAKLIASRLPFCVTPEDLETYGDEGMIAAVETFDPTRNVRFTSWANTKVYKAILDGLRGIDWMTRQTRKNQKAIESATQDSHNRKGRPPSEMELAHALRRTRRSFLASRTVAGRELHNVAFLARDRTDHGGEGYHAGQFRDKKVPVPGAALENDEAFCRLVRGTSRMERIVFMAYYRDNWTMREIGGLLEMSESRVSQIHTETLARFREREELSCQYQHS